MKTKHNEPSEALNAVQPGDAEAVGTEEAEEGLTLRDHLLALRKVIIVCVAAVGVGFLISFYFVIDPLLAWITRPIEQRGVQVIYTAVSEALTTKLKVAIVTGIVIAFPVIIWQVWAFVKPALYPKEQRSFRVFFFFALLLFLLGIVFCYGAVFFLAIDFFMVSGEGLATPMLSLDKYINFLFGFLLPFGVAFMLPVFIYITTKVGLTTPEMLVSKRKFVILGIFVLAAILTPPDVVSQVLLGIPMLLLYEAGILVSRLVKKQARA
ncbi:MAG: twin-arginine translocase subunit TatC [Clostridia bacterium]|nr:twin-arginine translocase subunit TatC [Clostridia bacterium]